MQSIANRVLRHATEQDLMGTMALILGGISGSGGEIETGNCFLPSDRSFLPLRSHLTCFHARNCHQEGELITGILLFLLRSCMAIGMISKIDVATNLTGSRNIVPDISSIISF